MKALVLTAESTYARFRCPHTTTSALTFSTIHPIAVKGLIGAVMGIDYEELYDYTKEMKIGIQVLCEVHKDMQSFNLIAQTNNNGAANFQSRVEFLRDVKYRLFISDNEEKIVKISQTLQKQEYVFTPYLGCSEHIAKLFFEGNYDSMESEKDIVDTVIPKDYAVVNENNKLHFYLDRVPISNNKDREYVEYNNVLFSPQNKIKVKDCPVAKVGNYHVFFF